MNIRRYRAFTTVPDGGNPAAVVTDADNMTTDQMQELAAEIGYSETAFVRALPGADTYEVRYFAPKTEIPFCGHATIAAAIAVAAEVRPADGLVFHTQSGEVPIAVTESDGHLIAEITTVTPGLRDVTQVDVAEALAALRLSTHDLDLSAPPALAYAGAWHLVIALGSRETLRALDYDFERMAALSDRLGIATAQIFWRESPSMYHSRNPFPTGGVYEDPATGAAAAALGAYLRELGWHGGDDVFTIIQGEDMGNRSEIRVRYLAGDDRVRISGSAVALSIPRQDLPSTADGRVLPERHR